MEKLIIYFALFLFSFVNYAQVDREYETRSIKGKFKITYIDSTKNYYTINAVSDNNTQILILQKKLKRKERKKILKETKVDKIIIGQTYYFNLENWFYSFAIYGSANDRIIIDKKVIYEKGKSQHFVYKTINLKGIYYKI